MEQLANNALTALNGGISAGATTLVVSSAASFPASASFRIIVDNELMLVTGVAGTTLTVTRGIEGTAAASHANGAAVAQVLSVAGLLQYVLDRGLTSLGDWKPATPGTYDQEFEGTADALPSGWTWTGSAPVANGDTLTVNSRWPSLLTIEGSSNHAYTLKYSGFAPAGAFGIWTKMFVAPAEAADSYNAQIYVFNAAESEGMAAQLRASGKEAVGIRGLHTIASAENIGFGSSGSGMVAVDQAAGSIYLGMTRDGSNVWTLWYSRNGIAWQRYYTSETHAFTADHINIKGGVPAVPGFFGVDWVRYRADLNFPRPN